MPAWILGTGSTRFDRHPDKTHRELATDAVSAALSDAGDPAVEAVWFGNCAMDRWGQGNLRGQVGLAPLVAAGRLDGTAPVTNVEAGCATGSVALHGALDAVAAGSVDIALAAGVEKVFFDGDPAATLGVFASGIDRLHPGEWERFYAQQAAAHDVPFAPERWRVLFLDLHAAQGLDHLRRTGGTVDDLAAVAAKNRANGAGNPRAQKRTAKTVAQVLADKQVVGPLTRSMCCPVSDGAAAAVVCSDKALQRLPSAVRDRAIPVQSWARAGGTFRDLLAPSVNRHAADRAFARVPFGPDAIDVVELHDATAACELLHLEMLRLVPDGQAAQWTREGRTARDGDLPVNPSGGLEAKGHPLGATGLGQIDELVGQLRGEAEALQVTRDGGAPRLALAHNAGGQIGWDEAVASVTILGWT